MHPNAIIAVAASRRCEALTKEIFGREMAYVPWMRPGFELGLAMQKIAKENPEVRAIMMGQHGFISWQDDDKLCYEETLRFIEKASEYIENKYHAKGATPKPLAARNARHSTSIGGARCWPRFSRGFADRFRSRSASSAPFRMMRRFFVT
jgi:Uncharacterized conserved protein